jgi:hypothetical protein
MRQVHSGLPNSLRTRLWMVPPLLVGIFAFSWGIRTGRIVLPSLALDQQRAIELQFDAEDAKFCDQFGFAPGTLHYGACKRNLLVMRRRDQELQNTIYF